MLANTRSRTVFGLQHKYSNEYVERSSGSPLGCFESQIEPGRTGEVPVIKRKSSAARLVTSSVCSPSGGHDSASSSSGQPSMRPASSCSFLDGPRGLAGGGSPAIEEEDDGCQGRLDTSGHLAGTLRRSCLRKPGLSELKDPRRPKTNESAAPRCALDVLTPAVAAVALDCSLRGPPGVIKDLGLMAPPPVASALLEAALAEGPDEDVFL